VVRVQTTSAVCLLPPADPAILEGMDPERDDYRDGGLPSWTPPHWMLVIAVAAVVLLVVAGVGLLPLVFFAR
jgi:hypothetical protein